MGHRPLTPAVTPPRHQLPSRDLRRVHARGHRRGVGRHSVVEALPVTTTAYDPDAFDAEILAEREVPRPDVWACDPGAHKYPKGCRCSTCSDYERARRQRYKRKDTRP